MKRLTQEQLDQIDSKFSYDPETGELTRHFKRRGDRPAITYSAKPGREAATPVVKYAGIRLIPTDLIYYIMTGRIAPFRTRRVNLEGGWEWRNIVLYDHQLDRTSAQGLIYFSKNKGAWALRRPDKPHIYKLFNSYEAAEEELDRLLEVVVSPNKKVDVETRAYGWWYCHRLTSDRKARANARQHTKKLAPDHPLRKSYFPNLEPTIDEVNNEQDTKDPSSCVGQQ